MASNVSEAAKSLIPRGIAVMKVNKHDADSRYTEFFGQIGVIEHFYQEMEPGTSIKSQMCFIIFKEGETATRLIEQKSVKIGQRTHGIRALKLETAQVILNSLQSTGSQQQTTTPRYSAAAKAKIPTRLNVLKDKYATREEFASDIYALINADRATAEEQARKTTTHLQRYQLRPPKDGKMLQIEFWIDERRADAANTISKFKKGDIVLFQGKSVAGNYWQTSARIISSPGIKTSSYLARLNDGKISMNETGPDQITISQVYLFAPFNRQARALAKISRGEGDGLIVDCILGIVRKQNESHEFADRELVYECGSIPMLNAAQQECVKMALSYAISIIQGPPGTGKTNTIAVLVFILLKILLGELILVIAPSNVAADEACLRIAKTGLSPVRIYSKSHEEEDKLPCQDMALHVLTLREGGELYKRLKQKEKDGKLRGNDERTLRQLEKRTQEAILKRAGVFVTTCCTAGLPIVEHVKPTILIHDEASQATVAESLVAIMTGVRRVVLVGDHKQLPPLVLSQRAEGAGLGKSLLERLIDLGVPHTMLKVQHRMHPDISAFPSRAFYNNELVDRVDIELRNEAAHAAELPDNKSAGFVAISGLEEKHGTSYFNREQAEFVLKAASVIMDHNVPPSQISIISYYEAQTNLIKEMIREAGQRGDRRFSNERGQIEVSNVDAFQGRENDFIFISTVRSNERRNVGFISDSRRLNVSITRPKCLLIIMGDHETLSADPTMHALLQHYQDGGLLFEGSPGDYKTAKVDLPAAKKPSINERWERDATDDFEESITLNLDGVSFPFKCRECEATMQTAEDAYKHLRSNGHITKMGEKAARQ